MSDRAWERLSEAQRESRRLDGPALLIDLTAVRQRDVPADLSTFPVPFTYVYGTSQAPYYRSLALKLAAVNPAIETVEIREADHAAHLRNSAALGADHSRTMGASVRVGVTGASGLIGSSLVAALHERNDSVVTFVRPSSRETQDERGALGSLTPSPRRGRPSSRR